MVQHQTNEKEIPLAGNGEVGRGTVNHAEC